MDENVKNTRALHEYALKGIDESILQQATDLRNIRNQAAVLIAANGVSASFFAEKFFSNVGGQSTDIPFGPCGCIAIVLFFLSLCFAASIMWPKPGWYFDIAPLALIEILGKEAAKISHEEMLFKIVQQRDIHFKKKRRTIGRRTNKLEGVLILSRGASAVLVSRVSVKMEN